MRTFWGTGCRLHHIECKWKPTESSIKLTLAETKLLGKLNDQKTLLAESLPHDDVIQNQLSPRSSA